MRAIPGFVWAGMAILKLGWDDSPPAEYRGGVLTIGNFDGVHRGHVALLTAGRHQAARVGGPVIAMTFDPHPLLLLRPKQFQPLLTTAADRAHLLEANGADHVVILPTTPALLEHTAGEFFEHIIRQRLNAQALVEGVNFSFGRGREGNPETLQNLAAPLGMGVTIVPPLTTPDGVAISSSRVRRVLVQGAVTEAMELLGRPYRLHGTVGPGQRRGAGLGFPTANLEQCPTLIPGDGVYAVRAHYKRKAWPAAANIGPNPTFGENARKVEVHLIGFQGDLYGQELAIDFMARLRDTQRFGSVDALVAQLRTDVDHARQIIDTGEGGKHAG